MWTFWRLLILSDVLRFSGLRAEATRVTDLGGTAVSLHRIGAYDAGSRAKDRTVSNHLCRDPYTGLVGLGAT
jgi:hypothetical protein